MSNERIARLDPGLTGTDSKFLKRASLSHLDKENRRTTILVSVQRGPFKQEINKHQSSFARVGHKTNETKNDERLKQR